MWQMLWKFRASGSATGEGAVRAQQVPCSEVLCPETLMKKKFSHNMYPGGSQQFVTVAD